MLPLGRCFLSSASNSSGRRALPHLLLLQRSPAFRVSASGSKMSREDGGGRADRLDGATSTSTPADDADVRSSKKALRSSIVAALKALPDEELAAQSAEIARLVLSSRLWASSTKVGVYLAAPRLREVDTEALVSAALLSGEGGGGDEEGGATEAANGEESDAKKKRLYVPIVGKGPQEMCLVHLDSLDGLKIVPPFGIREPSKTYGDGVTPREDALSADIDTLFLPGVAFDRLGRRLGRGLGYYDAWAHRARRASVEAAAAREGTAATDADDESGPLLVGLAFSQQMLPAGSGGGVPVEEHDVGLDAVVVAGEGVVATSERGRRRLLSE